MRNYEQHYHNMVANAASDITDSMMRDMSGLRRTLIIKPANSEPGKEAWGEIDAITEMQSVPGGWEVATSEPITGFMNRTQLTAWIRRLNLPIINPAA